MPLPAKAEAAGVVVAGLAAGAPAGVVAGAPPKMDFVGVAPKVDDPNRDLGAAVAWPNRFDVVEVVWPKTFVLGCAAAWPKTVAADCPNAGADGPWPNIEAADGAADVVTGCPKIVVAAGVGAGCPKRDEELVVVATG